MIERCCDIVPVLSKEFLDVQATLECRFTLKRVCDMISDKKIRSNAPYR